MGALRIIKAAKSLIVRLVNYAAADTDDFGMNSWRELRKCLNNYFFKLKILKLQSGIDIRVKICA